MDNIKPDKTLDCTGLFCPLPVVKTKQEIDKLKSGEVLELIADDPGSKLDIPAWCNTTGNILIFTEFTKDEYKFFIRKK
ncbi:MAG: sulfurtransferase TusA family protein [Elusimicrobiota bacterium]